MEQAEEGRGDAEGFVSTEQNASQSVCKDDYRADRGDLSDRGDLDDCGDQWSLIMVIVVIKGDRGPDIDWYCSFILLGFESWLIYDLHTHMYEQTSENQRNA